ncbi:secretion lowering protein [Scheffersomyces coipomensis]|uniref:secretion lowering protein n=1 Tax=Scheffersomyces coipomensis TaxID=1788519 RepID=UPI00315DBCBF
MSESQSSIDQLTPAQSDTFHQFKLITGLTDNEDDNDNIISLLAFNEYNVNHAINAFFESGFDSLQYHTPNVVPATPNSTNVESERSRTPLETFSSGIDIHDEISNIHNRRHSNNMHTTSNLQQQFFMENLIPRLPKAPRISNGWQLDVGIHTSIMETRQREKELSEQVIDEKEVELTDDSTMSSDTSKKIHVSLWLILLIIPRTLLNLIISAFKYLFGFGKLKLSSSSSSNYNKLPKSFNYDQDFDFDYTFLPWIEQEFEKLSPKEEEDPIEENPSQTTASVTTTSSSSVGELFEKFNIESTNFNEVHERCQKHYLWLFVIIINSHQDSIKFLHTLVHDPHFNRLFNKSTGEFKESIIYINNVTKSPETFELGTIYKIKRIPYIMLIGNVSPSPEIMASMSIVYKSNLILQELLRGGENEHDELRKLSKKVFKNIYKSMEIFNPQLISKRFDQQEIEFARLIKQQQDNAFEKSLKQDQLKKIKREKLITLQKSIALKQNLRLKFLLNLIKSKYHTSITNNESSDVTKVAIKLPTGKRIINTFDKSISVNSIHLYVELILFMAEQNIADDDESVKIDELIADIPFDDEDYEDLTMDQYFELYKFKFNLIQPFPKRIIVANDDSIGSIEEFKSGANLLVEYNDDDEEDEDEDDEELELEDNDDDVDDDDDDDDDDTTNDYYEQ